MSHEKAIDRIEFLLGQGAIEGRLDPSLIEAFLALKRKAEIADYCLGNLEVVDTYEGCDGTITHQCQLLVKALDDKDQGDDLEKNIRYEMAQP